MESPKFPSNFPKRESRILGALSKLDEFLLNPHVRICSVAVPGTSRNNSSENWEPAGDRSLNDPYPEVSVSACSTSNLTKSDQDETHHNLHILYWRKNDFFNLKGFFPVTSTKKMFFWQIICSNPPSSVKYVSFCLEDLRDLESSRICTFCTQCLIFMRKNIEV